MLIYGLKGDPSYSYRNCRDNIFELLPRIRERLLCLLFVTLRGNGPRGGRVGIPLRAQQRGCLVSFSVWRHFPCVLPRIVPSSPGDQEILTDLKTRSAWKPSRQHKRHVVIRHPRLCTAGLADIGPMRTIRRQRLVMRLEVPSIVVDRWIDAGSGISKLV
jgi:hypothetical protein